MGVRRRLLNILTAAAVLLLTLIWSPLAPVASADGTNVLTNPGCESGTTGFSGYAATISVSTSVKHSGSASCKAVSTGGVFTLQSTQAYANPQVGQVSTGSAWVRSDTNAGHDIYVALRERGGSSPSRTVYGSVVHLSTTWQPVTASITVASAGRTGLDFYLAEDPGGSGHTFYADDMTFIPTSGSTSTSPSGQAMPVGDLPGWHQIFAEDFTVDSAPGSWGASCANDPDPGGKIVYTGARGTRWTTYPDCFTDTYQHRPYRSDQVLSTHGGLLDFYLHNVGGQPAGAAPGPVINNASSSPYQTYGRYTARFRLDTTSLSEYHIAWLLWPSNDNDWQCAESDYPESSLGSTTTSAFAHYGCSGSQDEFDRAIDYTQWHTFTQEWSPGVRRYYLDDTLIGTSTHSVYSGPQRWQLQTETNGNGTHSGHLFVDWVAAYSYQP